MEHTLHATNPRLCSPSLPPTARWGEQDITRSEKLSHAGYVTGCSPTAGRWQSRSNQAVQRGPEHEQGRGGEGRAERKGGRGKAPGSRRGGRAEVSRLRQRCRPGHGRAATAEQVPGCDTGAGKPACSAQTLSQLS